MISDTLRKYGIKIIGRVALETPMIQCRALWKARKPFSIGPYKFNKTRALCDDEGKKLGLCFGITFDGTGDCPCLCIFDRSNDLGVAPEFDWELADAEPKAKLVAHIARMIKKLESLDKRRESKAVARTALEKPRNYTVRDLFEDRPEDIEIDGFKMSLHADNENLVRYAMTTYAEGTTSLTILDTLNDNMFRVMIEGSFTSGLRWKDVCRGNTQVSAVLKATFSKQAAARVALEDNEIRSLDDFPDTFRILSQDFSANSRSGKLVYKSKSRTIVVFAYGAGKGVLITNSLGSGKTLDFPISKADLYKAFKNASDSDKKVPAHKRIFGRVALEKQRECTIQDLYDEKPESIIVKIDGKDVKLKCEHPSNDFLYYHNAARGFTFCLQKPHAIIEHQGFRVLLDGPKRGENKFRKWLPAAMTIKEAFEIARKEYHAD